MRSGFVAGDAAVLKRFLLYRTYCGGAMSPPVQAASIAAWNDEAHVEENRATDLTDTVPSSADHTILREILIVADHNAYHIGELGILRQVDHAWGPGHE
jgi:aspartate/methionine/tyrosine aminotransferase